MLTSAQCRSNTPHRRSNKVLFFGFFNQIIPEVGLLFWRFSPIFVFFLYIFNKNTYSTIFSSDLRPKFPKNLWNRPKFGAISSQSSQPNHSTSAVRGSCTSCRWQNLPTFSLSTSIELFSDRSRFESWRIFSYRIQSWLTFRKMSPLSSFTAALAGKTLSPIGVILHVPRRIQRPQHGSKVNKNSFLISY